jgi:hypothetical protein
MPILRSGDRAAVIVKAGADVGKLLRVVEVWDVGGAREIRTVPIGCAPEHKRVAYDRWSRATGARINGGNEILRPAAPREVAVWQATEALKKAKSDEGRLRGWWSAAVDLLAQKRAQLADAACERRAAEHEEAQRKLREAEAALQAAEAGSP